MAEPRRKLLKLIRLARSRDHIAALRHGVAAAVEHRTVAFHNEARTVLDVGSNRGQFALFAAQRFPRADVHCFEPIPVARDKLRQVVGHRPNLTIHPLALGSAGGVADIHVSFDDDSSSLLPASPRQLTTFPGSRGVDVVTVELGRLDERLRPEDVRRPCLLKIDVQGFEAQVLEGATGLMPVIDEILVECSFVELYEQQQLADDIICQLRLPGFRLRGVFNLTTDDSGGCLQADLLFTRDEPTR